MSTSRTSVLLDLGSPMDSCDNSENEDNILPNSLDSFDAVIVTHHHKDHYGLIEHINVDVPVYISKLAMRLIQSGRIFCGDRQLVNNFRHFQAGKPFIIGDLRITPYPVDHSAADSYSFLIEGEGKRLFYSGDFRAHGRKSKLFEHLLKIVPKNIDVLLIEGTLLGREINRLLDERAIEELMLEHLKSEPGPSFLICSSQNIDRIVTAYRASKRAGRIFVVDIYTAWILNEISMVSNNTPRIEWDDVRVLSKGRTAARHYVTIKKNPEYFEGFVRALYRKNNVIRHEELKKEPGRYFLKVPYVGWLINELDVKSSGVIYSQWKGYMSEQYNPTGYLHLKRLKENPRVNFVTIHTSGHAVVKDLKRLIDAISPTTIIPVHTEHGDKYKEFFDNVVWLKDGNKLML